jgi:glycosyltransferase involved in cell wall biosynthesis
MPPFPLTGRPLRVAIVARRFWPLVGEREMVIADLASEWARQGAQPTVVTGRWSSTWPERVDYREYPVVRLVSPVQPYWGTLRFTNALAAWLRTERDSIDAVCVSGLQYDAYAVTGTLADAPVPVVLRAESCGPLGDCAWQDSQPFGWYLRRRCRQASAIVAPTRGVAEELSRAGYPAERICRIENGVWCPDAVDAEARHAARKALSDVNVELALTDTTPLAVYIGPLERECGLEDLVASWPVVVARWPNARLWLVGEGSAGPRLAARVDQLGLHRRVVLPGVADDWSEVVAAADVFVWPSARVESLTAIQRAMAAGQAIVAADCPSTRRRVGDEGGLFVPEGDRAQWAATLDRLFSDGAFRMSLGEAARRRVRQEYSLENCARRHLELFEKVVHARAAARGS